jgi:hypothetical protein
MWPRLRASRGETVTFIMFLQPDGFGAVPMTGYFPAGGMTRSNPMN